MPSASHPLKIPVFGGGVNRNSGSILCRPSSACKYCSCRGNITIFARSAASVGPSGPQFWASQSGCARVPVRAIQDGSGTTELPRFSPRTDGFNPVLITQNQAFWYWFIVVLRFLRLVIVVPLVEEIFWRGFLMRFLCDIDGDYWKVPFGKFHWLSLVVVTAMFVMAHAPVDYVAAAVFGILMYGVAVKTKSLTACIVMHATANFILGLYVLSTQQWGYW